MPPANRTDICCQKLAKKRLEDAPTVFCITLIFGFLFYIYAKQPIPAIIWILSGCIAFVISISCFGGNKRSRKLIGTQDPILLLAANFIVSILYQLPCVIFFLSLPDVGKVASPIIVYAYLISVAFRYNQSRLAAFTSMAPPLMVMLYMGMALFSVGAATYFQTLAGATGTILTYHAYSISRLARSNFEQCALLESMQDEFSHGRRRFRIEKSRLLKNVAREMRPSFLGIIGAIDDISSRRENKEGSFCPLNELKQHGVNLLLFLNCLTDNTNTVNAHNTQETFFSVHSLIYSLENEMPESTGENHPTLIIRNYCKPGIKMGVDKHRVRLLLSLALNMTANVATKGSTIVNIRLNENSVQNEISFEFFHSPQKSHVENGNFMLPDDSIWHEAKENRHSMLTSFPLLEALLEDLDGTITRNASFPGVQSFTLAIPVSLLLAPGYPAYLDHAVYKRQLSERYKGEYTPPTPDPLSGLIVKTSSPWAIRK